MQAIHPTLARYMFLSFDAYEGHGAVERRPAGV